VTTSPDVVENVLGTNLRGTIWGCQAVAKTMLLQKREANDTGCIINVSSLLAVKGGRGSMVYAASKAGVLGKGKSGKAGSCLGLTTPRSHKIASS
jgi:NAD(P)-dependent dehydrogenase (short-subunit alcohol dehydrogenase family)